MADGNLAEDAYGRGDGVSILDPARGDRSSIKQQSQKSNKGTNFEAQNEKGPDGKWASRQMQKQVNGGRQSQQHIIADQPGVVASGGDMGDAGLGNCSRLLRLPNETKRISIQSNLLLNLKVLPTTGERIRLHQWRWLPFQRWPMTEDWTTQLPQFFSTPSQLQPGQLSSSRTAQWPNDQCPPVTQHYWD